MVPKLQCFCYNPCKYFRISEVIFSEEVSGVKNSRISEIYQNVSAAAQGICHLSETLFPIVSLQRSPVLSICNVSNKIC